MVRIKVDMHFHPSMGDNPTPAQCWEILQKCKACNLTALVITDHPYKNPRVQFQALYNTQQYLLKKDPQEYGWLNYFVLFPGVEAMALEGFEVILFDYRVRRRGSAKIYNIREASTLITTSYHHTGEDIIRIAKGYGFAVYVPHPYIGAEYSPIEILGRTKEGQLKIMEIIKKYNIGIEVHNEGMGPLLDVFGRLKIQPVPRLLMMRDTPADLISQAAFAGGGSDAHTPTSMGTGLIFDHNGPLTREAVYATIVSSRAATIVAPKRSILEWAGSHLARHPYGKAPLIWWELCSEKRIKEEVLKERALILEAYVQAHEHPEIDINALIHFKDIFPGSDIMNQFSEDQKKRLKVAYVNRILAQISQGRHLNVDKSVTRDLLLEAYTRAVELRMDGSQIEQAFGGRESLWNALKPEQRKRIGTARPRNI